MGKMPTNSLGKSSELKLHCFCLFDAHSMPKDKFSACRARRALVSEMLQACSILQFNAK